MSAESGTGFRHFHEQLDELKRKLLEMSGHAERLVDLSISALLDHDREKAEQVIAGDKIVNSLEVEIEQLAVSLLALQQPMARDLRFIVGTIKVSSDLERVGDHAVNIAESALNLVDQGGSITPSPELEDMARRARTMLGDALDAFTRADGALGREVCKADELDATGARIVDTLLMNAPGATTATKLRALRVADCFLDDGLFRDLVHEHANTRQSAEAAEGTASFLEKRAPSWYPGKA